MKIDQSRIYAAKLLYQFSIISTFFNIISVPYNAIINAHENMFFLAILGIFESLLKLAIAFYLIFSLNDKLIVYGFLMSILSLILLIVRQFYCHIKYEEAIISPKKYFDKQLFNEMTNFAGWSFLGSSSSIFTNYGQGIVLNVFFGAKINASQGIATQINGQLSAFANTMLQALNPVFAKSVGAGNKDLMIKASMIGSKISFFLSAIFFIPFLIETSFTLNIWLKDVPDFAVVFCQLLLVKSLIEQLFKTIASTITAHGNIKNYQIVSSILCFLPLIISYFLFVKGFPAYYLYIVFIIYTILASCVILFFTWNNFRFPVNEFIKKILIKSVLTFLLIFFVSRIPVLFFDDSLFRLFIVVITTFIMSPICIWFLDLTLKRNKLKNLLKPFQEKIFKKNYSMSLNYDFVIIPLYNKVHTIKRTLNSVINQSFQDFEIIIVNDGSTDNLYN